MLLRKSFQSHLSSRSHTTGSFVSCYQQSKIIDKVIASLLVKHMNEKQLLEPMQSAYRERHSTETGLLRVHNDIIMAIDRGTVSFSCSWIYQLRLTWLIILFWWIVKALYWYWWYWFKRITVLFVGEISVCVYWRCALRGESAVLRGTPILCFRSNRILYIYYTSWCYHAPLQYTISYFCGWHPTVLLFRS